MPRIPLEDNLADVLHKAQRGRNLTDAQLVTRAAVSPADLVRLRAGEVAEPVLHAVAAALALSAPALLALARREWYPTQPVFPRGFAMVHTTYAGDLGVNSYLVWDPRTRLAAAFDTGATAQPMLDLIHTEHLTLRYLFLTHTHEDHVAGLAELAGSGPEVWASDREPADWPGARVFRENAHFHLGALAIKTLLTSGHSPGQTTYYITGLSWPLAVVGDALFASSIGGSAGRFAEQWNHDRRKILTLPGDTVLACGHGPLTTVRQEKQHNPFFAH